MKSVITIPLVCLCAWVVVVEAAEPLKDPRLRDEDISMTMVTVDVARNAVGHYVYTYDIDSPISNLGKVLTFGVDISCEAKPDARGFDASDYPRNPALRAQNFSEDGKHVPVAVDAPMGQAAIVTIAVHNGVGWAVGVEPGGVSRGMTIISPYPPGSRVYTLIPSIRYKEEQWDYSNVEEEDPEVPWLEDWIVTGVTTGPACPGEEYPDSGDDGGDKRFPGTRFRGESMESNELLTYSTPLRDHLHVPAGTKELEMTIHYHEAIDPRTFQVTPNKNYLRKLFNPKPGTSETIRIPLENGKNRIQLQVQGAFEPQRRKSKPTKNEQGHKGPPPKHDQGGELVSKDRDVFVVRVVRDDVPPGKRDKEHRKP